MSAMSMISELSAKGIRVRVIGSKVVLSAPKGALTEVLVSKARREKFALIRALRAIREKAGADWDLIAGDPDQLKAFTEPLMVAQMREQGIVPEHYTAETDCKHCGTVPIFEGCSLQVAGCPWCFNRIKGLLVPTIKI